MHSCCSRSADSARGFLCPALITQLIPAKPKVSAKKLVYAHEHERQHGFLVTPKKQQPGKKLPLVVFIHGGGWQEKSTAQSAAPGRRQAPLHMVSRGP